MPDICTEVITYLKTKSAITTLVGAGSEARIYYGDAKQGVSLPYIVIRVFEGESAEHLNGISGIATNRVEINCYGSTSSEGYSLAEAVRLAPMQKYRGMMGSTYVHEVASPQGYSRDFDTPSNGDNRKRFNFVRDYFIHHAEDKEA
jgi:hypothetical protein